MAIRLIFSLAGHWVRRPCSSTKGRSSRGRSVRSMGLSLADERTVANGLRGRHPSFHPPPEESTLLCVRVSVPARDAVPPPLLKRLPERLFDDPILANRSPC